MSVHEIDYHGSRGSSSRAKKDDANRISLARFSSLTSSSSSLTQPQEPDEQTSASTLADTLLALMT